MFMEPLLNKVGIIGLGIVGKATLRSLVEYVGEIYSYDINPARSNNSLEDTINCDLVFICLPTPKHKDKINGVTVHYIHQFFTEVRNSEVPFVIKSTVPIGTTRSISEIYNIPNIVHSPEFLTQRCALTDAFTPSRNIIGTPSSNRNKASDILYNLYCQRFIGTPIYDMSSDESETVKLAQNSFFAMCVSFWNEVNTLCASAKMDWKTILGAILADGRVPHSHVHVPGHQGKYGYGGKCLVKDISQFIEELSSRNLLASVTSAVQYRNKFDSERTDNDVPNDNR